jgi:hypothetical protein
VRHGLPPPCFALFPSESRTLRTPPRSANYWLLATLSRGEIVRAHRVA